MTKIKIVKNVSVDLEDTSTSINTEKFNMINYIKEQLRQLDTSNTKASISSVKKLSIHDFIVQGKRFQIKQPPVLTINNNTRVSDIIVKVGVSQQNLKEFLQSIINEVVQSN